MLKGICKEFVTVKISDNPLYDEAVFILKNSAPAQKSKEDMLFEANRILCQNGVKKPGKRRKLLLSILFSIFFLILGAFIGFILGLLF